MSQRITKDGTCAVRAMHDCLGAALRPPPAFTHRKTRTDRLTSSGTSQQRLNMFLRIWEWKKVMACRKSRAPLQSIGGEAGLFAPRRGKKRAAKSINHEVEREPLSRGEDGCRKNPTQITNGPQLFTTIQACYFSQRSCSSNKDSVCSVAKTNKQTNSLCPAKEKKNTWKKTCPL